MAVKFGRFSTIRNILIRSGFKEGKHFKAFAYPNKRFMPYFGRQRLADDVSAGIFIASGANFNSLLALSSLIAAPIIHRRRENVTRAEEAKEAKRAATCQPTAELLRRMKISHNFTHLAYTRYGRRIYLMTNDAAEALQNAKHGKRVFTTEVEKVV